MNAGNRIERGWVERGKDREREREREREKGREGEKGGERWRQIVREWKGAKEVEGDMSVKEKKIKKKE